MSDKYLVISSDCHAGLPADQYRDYIDPQFRGTYDEWVAAAESMRNARMGPSEDRDKWVAEWREEIEDHGGMRGSWDANIRDKELGGACAEHRGETAHVTEIGAPGVLREVALRAQVEAEGADRRVEAHRSAWGGPTRPA